MLSQHRTPGFYPLVRYASLALSLSVLVWSAGCSKGAKDVVTGKVTLAGQKVNGAVTFIGPDKKQVTGGIVNGVYTIENPPKGDNIVLVKGHGDAMPGAAKNLGGAVADPTPDKSGGDMMKDNRVKSDLGVPPPPKYASEATSGLKFTVTGGKQTNDITLEAPAQDGK